MDGVPRRSGYRGCSIDKQFHRFGLFARGDRRVYFSKGLYFEKAAIVSVESNFSGRSIYSSK
jgi:hypothetical protein